MATITMACLWSSWLKICFDRHLRTRELPANYSPREQSNSHIGQRAVTSLDSPDGMQFLYLLAADLLLLTHVLFVAFVIFVLFVADRLRGLRG